MSYTTVLTPVQVLDNLKKRLVQCQRDFTKNPNATRFNVQARAAFVYQQAFYFLHGTWRTSEQKFAFLVELSKEPNCNWGDVVCRHTLGMNLHRALNEHGTFS